MQEGTVFCSTLHVCTVCKHSGVSNVQEEALGSIPVLLRKATARIFLVKVLFSK